MFLVLAQLALALLLWDTQRYATCVTASCEPRDKTSCLILVSTEPEQKHTGAARQRHSEHSLLRHV